MFWEETKITIAQLYKVGLLAKTIMKHLLKTTLLLLLLSFNFSCSQQLQMKTLSDAKKIEINKAKFIGKPLSQLLATIKVPIKSVQATPNKNKNEVNRLTFRYITYDEYRKTWGKEIQDRPTQLVVVFNQNWDTLGNLCRPKENPQCAEWLPEDEKNLGDLIIYDIYVLGKN
ncbi:hypothetical protein [Bergeyella sp. RCAD1439]|uniref:hypothetical protein n=1 Tax=Bergeyella anatis TaxID=3113737 RepID=UPI002E199928|nr:hypothetical protein [Bergeyella sp. RCAD1439]